MLVDQDISVSSATLVHIGDSLVDIVHRPSFRPSLDLVVTGKLQHLRDSGCRGSDGRSTEVDVACKVSSDRALGIYEHTHNKDERRDLGNTVGLGRSNGHEVATGPKEGEVISQWHIGLVCHVSRQPRNAVLNVLLVEMIKSRDLR